MAGMFYSLQEAAAKLNRTEEEVKEIVKQGRLREFRDGANLLFKIDEVEALLSDTSFTASKKGPAEGKPEADDEIFLAPEPGEEAGAVGEDEGDYKLADDSLGETKVVSKEGSLAGDTLGATKAGAGEASLEEIEGDVNLDTFGSGSGLLDLSLQADDTSLGGILDEIYTPEGEEGKEEKGEGKKAEASAVEVAAEAEQLMPEEAPAAAEVGAEAPAIIRAYAEPVPDAVSKAFGIMLFLPLLAIIYTAIVTVAGFSNMMPTILAPVQRLIWYIAIGAAVAAGLIIGVGFMAGGKGKAGKPAVKKEKAKKEKKAKKDKKAKKTEEAPPAEIAEPEAEPEIKTE
jgi:hypothetical protein